MAHDQQNLWESFASEWETPHVWEVTRVTSADIQRATTNQEAMRIVRENIQKHMPQQVARETLAWIRLLLNK